MTKAEKAQAIDDIGRMLWEGVIEEHPAIWFVMRLYKVDLGTADDMVTEAMANHMVDELEYGLKKIGDKRVGH
ncbi:hypothetical protein D1J63_32125 [Streptomyces sp. KPB2]|uniref:hypothetical protein n=1 Tax=Streptomyces TaxID=1883 RepID=UPI000F6D30E4|nr:MULTISPECIES: hypothetical protein [unclassified Streptomyces]AZM79080.1 hypothetical protein D1J63_32125 [Streptomyces sp. KPB2]MBH5132415.1 hypothetical protein [Streptomyces sp. HB-N217]